MTAKPDLDRFASAEALRSRHEDLLSSAQSKDESLGALPTQAIKEFLSRAAATGAVILDPRERRAAQNILRFWTAELITRGVSDWQLPPLAKPRLGEDKPEAPAATDAKAGDQASTPGSAGPTEIEKTDDQELARSRTLVRIAASARQWRESGKTAAQGWLLKGEALDEAEQFARDDDDIRALVEASRKAETRSARRRNSLQAFLVVVLSGLCIGLYFALDKAWDRQALLEDSQARLERALDAANDESEATRQLKDKLEAAYADLTERGRELQQQLDQRQTVLQQTAELIRKLQGEGKIEASNIPKALLPYIAALDQAAPVARPDAPDQSARGYDPTFLQTLVRSQSKAADTGAIQIPLPNLNRSIAAEAYEGGQAINYVNFSIVLHKTRRMPIFSAVNLQRSRVVPLVRWADQFRPDPRVPVEVQLSPTSFEKSGLDHGRLVAPREIAWGDAFQGGTQSAGATAYYQTSFMTNVTPQYDTFKRGLWASAERYAREQFSARSDRVVIFSGPVFTADDATVEGIQVPRRFWKVLVATRPDNAASVLVEAYLMTQVDRDGVKIDSDEEFNPDALRVRVSAIERLTGLDFGEVVHAADIRSQTTAQTAKPATQTGRDLAAALAQATGSDESQRAVAMQLLLDALLSQEKIAAIDPRTFAEAIVSIAKTLGTLTPEAKGNVLTLLAAIPKERWNTERWIDVKAAARRALADAAANLGACSAGPQSCATLVATAKAKLDWPLATGRTVYVQFAGMVREDVKALSEKLRMLDWSIPGEERTSKAAGQNEVRSPDSDDDYHAAALLAADLRALGRSGVQPKRLQIPAKTKNLEIWLSI